MISVKYCGHLIYEPLIPLVLTIGFNKRISGFTYYRNALWVSDALWVLITYYLLLITYYSLLITSYLLLITYYLLLTNS